MVQDENVKLIIYISNYGLKKILFIFLFYFLQFSSQRWPIIINETSYEQIIGNKTTPFYYNLFGMKFHPNLQSYGIPNLTAYEAIYAEILKLCDLDPTSTIFLQYFSDLGLFEFIHFDYKQKNYFRCFTINCCSAC